MSTRSLHGLLTAGLIVAGLALVPAGEAQPHRHLDQHHELETYDNLDAWLGRAGWMRDHIRVSNGLMPMPARTPLNAQLSEPVAGDGYRVRSLVLETLPGFYLTGTLYAPEGDGPFPGVLSPHGHWTAGRFEDGEQASIPGRALSLARRGFVVLSYSMIGYNETEDHVPHRFDDEQYRLWGFSAMGLQTWNSLRALDYLVTLPEVDPDRIGMTGASGGGTQTFLLTAIDDRVRVSAPVNMISAHFQGGCICENAPLLRQGLHNVEVGALAAPRPLLLVSTSGDWTANTPETEFPFVRRVYGLFDRADRVANNHFDYPHNYNRDSREAVYAWFSRWLNDEEDASPEAGFTVPVLDAMRAELPGTPRSVDALFQYVRARENARVVNSRPASWSELYAYRNTFGKALGHIFHTDIRYDLDLEISPPADRTESTEAVLIVHDDTPESRRQADRAAARAAEQGRLVATFAPELAGDSAPPPDSVDYWSTYNPTPSQRAVQAIIQAAKTVHEREDVTAVDLRGLGAAGPLTLLARSQAPFVRNASVDFGGVAFESDDDFLDHASIPLVRKAGDFKTAAAAVAPAPLTLERLPDGELKSWIQALYQNLGAADMLTITP